MSSSSTNPLRNINRKHFPFMFFTSYLIDLKHGFYIQSNKEVKNIILIYHEHTETHTHKD